MISFKNHQPQAANPYSPMIIRKARAEDSLSVAHCLLLAMEEIVYRFIGRADKQLALEFMHFCVQRENNQYSWQNCWLAETSEGVIAAVNLYDGAMLHELRQPVIDALRNLYGREVLPEDETQAGEYYIDSLGVMPPYRGQGIGTMLLQFLIDEFTLKQGISLGILVDDDNPEAKRLYLKLGFCKTGHKTLMGKPMEQLHISQKTLKQKRPKGS